MFGRGETAGTAKKGDGMDLEFVRRQFPALDTDWIFFENAGGTQVPAAVMERAAHLFREGYVQPGYEYPQSERAAETLQQARRFVADWIHAPSPDQIIFGPSATALNRLLAAALAHQWNQGDEILVTVSDHEANVNPWMFLQKYGLRVKFWPINRETCELDLEDLGRLLSERTVLVALPHVSNLLGLENDIPAIARKVHEAGAWIYVDGVASAPHRPVDVSGWDLDFFVFSTYKTFGPHMAALYGKREILLRLPSPNHFFLGNTLPLKFELGTPNLEGAAALLGVRDYFANLAAHHRVSAMEKGWPGVLKLISDHETVLARRLIGGLQALPKVKIIGSTDPSTGARRVPVVSFAVSGRNPEVLARRLAKEKVAVGWGHFYAYRLVEFLGYLKQGGVLRASLVHYNTLEEIDRFCEALDRALP